MREILIFAGTTEGRRFSEVLSDAGIAHTVCVATAYGERVLSEGQKSFGVDCRGRRLVTVHQGRMNGEAIREFIRKGDYCAVVDATHPYAHEVTRNIRWAMEGTEIPCLRLKREEGSRGEGDHILYFNSHEECVKELEKSEGNILLTVGSKELEKYCVPGLRDRLYVRVLPGRESIALCEEQGICGRQLIAMQGPFSAELNEAILRQYRIICLVTKESGGAGGYPEKLEAAARAGIPVYVVGRPGEEGYSFAGICERLGEICGRDIKPEPPMEIVLAGIGMGGRHSLTGEVREAVERADILLGASRMLEICGQGKEKHPYYLAEQVVPFLEALQSESSLSGSRRIVILFSGDSGFHSGCKVLYRALLTEIREGRLRASLDILPGISSVSYLAACVGESYEDALICSMHGKALPNLARRIARNAKTFLLMSGAEDVNRLGRCMTEAGLEDCEVAVGYQLSCKEQQIYRLTPEECLDVKGEGLYTCLVKNPKPEAERLTHGMEDGAFVRARVPMTKEEIREVSICKLRLRENAIVYDIGSGTGSVAVEMASLSDGIQVYALERSAEAAELTRQNGQKFCLENLSVVEGEVPESFLQLPAPTHIFIGGSGGRLREILHALYEKNPRARVVINAVTLETFCEMREILTAFSVEQEELVQLQVSRTKEVGHYHMMQAENPVWIMAFQFVPKEI